MHTVALHIEFTCFLLHMFRGQLLWTVGVWFVDGGWIMGVGEMCWGGEFTGEKLDGAEGMRGVGVSWKNRGEG